METITVPKFLIEDLLNFKELELEQERRYAHGRPTRQCKLVKLFDEVQFIKDLLKG